MLKKRPILYPLFLFTCICLLSGCTSFSANLSLSTSTSKATSVVVKPTPTPDPMKAKAQLLLSKMSLDDKLAQMIMVEFVGTDYVATGLQQMVAQQQVGGVLYQPTIDQSGGDHNFDYPNDSIDSISAYSAQIKADGKITPDMPGELSPKVINYLRQTLKFNGVVITDGLYMAGLYNGVEPTDDQLAQVSVQAIEAGNDMVEGPSTPDQINSILASLEAAIQQGTLSQSQVDQSVTRILMMKIKYGIIK